MVISREDLDRISRLIHCVEFVHCGFDEALDVVKPGDFVYMDPPYAPVNATSFVGYTGDGFDLDSHNRLFARIKALHEEKILFAMSNAMVGLVTDSFADFTITRFSARRAINSKDPSATAMEVIVTNDTNESS